MARTYPKHWNPACATAVQFRSPNASTWSFSSGGLLPRQSYHHSGDFCTIILFRKGPWKPLGRQRGGQKIFSVWYNKQNLLKTLALYSVKVCKTSPKQTIPDLRTDTNRASSSIQKATILNELFIRQSQQSVSLEPEDTPSITTTPNITSPPQSITTSPEEVEKLLSSLDTHKSAGFDNIPTRLLKEAAAELAPSIAGLFNLSFATGGIPQDWKYATITPIPKAGNPSLPTNYRPISLLSILSKVQERIIYCRLYN